MTVGWCLCTRVESGGGDDPPQGRPSSGTSVLRGQWLSAPALTGPFFWWPKHLPGSQGLWEVPLASPEEVTHWLSLQYSTGISQCPWTKQKCQGNCLAPGNHIPPLQGQALGTTGHSSHASRTPGSSATSSLGSPTCMTEQNFSGLNLQPVPQQVRSCGRQPECPSSSELGASHNLQRTAEADMEGWGHIPAPRGWPHRRDCHTCT